MNLEGLTILVAILVALLGGAIGVFGTVIGSKLESNNVLRRFRRDQLNEIVLLLHKRKINREKINNHFIQSIDELHGIKTTREPYKNIKANDFGAISKDELDIRTEDIKEQGNFILTLIILHGWEIRENATESLKRESAYYQKLSEINKQGSFKDSDKNQLEKIRTEIQLSEDLLIMDISKLIYKRSRLEKLIDL